jgi:hypothetical protein
MGLPWIKLFVDLSEHPKGRRLGRVLGIDRGWSLPVALWQWCGKYAPEGDLLLESWEIADACQWSGDPDRLVEALVSCGWLDVIDGGWAVHGWAEYQGGHVEKILRDRRTAKETRDRKAAKKRAKHDDIATNATNARESRDGRALEGEREGERDREEDQLPSSGKPDTPKEPPTLPMDVKATPKPKKSRKKPDPSKSTGPAELERWRLRYAERLGLDEADVKLVEVDCVNFHRQRKARGIEKVMQALDGLDDFRLRQGAKVCLSDAGVQAGLAAQTVQKPKGRASDHNCNDRWRSKIEAQ